MEGNRRHFSGSGHDGGVDNFQVSKETFITDSTSKKNKSWLATNKRQGRDGETAAKKLSPFLTFPANLYVTKNSS